MKGENDLKEPYFKDLETNMEDIYEKKKKKRKTKQAELPRLIQESDKNVTSDWL